MALFIHFLLSSKEPQKERERPGALQHESVLYVVNGAAVAKEFVYQALLRHGEAVRRALSLSLCLLGGLFLN